MAMESQAEALGQLTTDDLEGKVLMMFIFFVSFLFYASRSVITLVKKDESKSL
jgi:hypothetical protein